MEALPRDSEHARSAVTGDPAVARGRDRAPNGRSRSPAPPSEDAIETAAAAGLRYVTDDEPGIRRRRRGKGFSYTSPNGERLGDFGVLSRIRSLAIPPAWTDVWICTDAAGHLQATGRDARGRKQYRYHPVWRAERERTKFDRLADFGKALPALRRRVKRDLELPGLPRERVVAAIVRLLEQSLVRIGNEEYARENGSYGLTTLKRRHAEVDGTTVRLEFDAKSGRRCETEIDDPRVVRIVRRCQELRGQKLFTYLDGERVHRELGSGDVNEYLRTVTGQEFTAKDFRTWGGTVHAASLLRSSAREELDERERKRCVVESVREVASRLGNTPAVCLRHYVHPFVIEAFQDGALLRRAERPVPREPRGLDADERFALALLGRRRRRAREAGPSRSPKAARSRKRTVRPTAGQPPPVTRRGGSVASRRGASRSAPRPRSIV